MATWYYANGDTQEGPVEASEIERLIRTGRVGAATLLWRQGLSDWEPAGQHFTLAPAAPAGRAPGTPPPRPASPAAAAPAAAPAHSPAWTAQPQGGAETQIGADGLYVGAPARSFGEAISVCFSNYVRFRGRASRSEYWFFVLFLLLLGIATTVLDLLLFPGTMETGGPINGLTSLATLLPSLAVTWRRLHDTDRSGWWVGGFYLAMAVLAGVIFAAIGASGAADPTDTLIAVLPLIGLLMIVYGIVLLVFLCQKGTPGPNRFG